jgi:hypothetical protein
MMSAGNGWGLGGLIAFEIVSTVAFTPTPRSAFGTLAIFTARLPGFGLLAYIFSAQTKQ